MTRDTFKAKGVPECCCTQADAWRSAFIEERAARYRGEGMKIEQARIHAETDSVAALAPQPPAEAQPVGELIEDGAETEEGDHFIHQFVGPRKLPEGTKLYAHPPPSAPVGVEAAEHANVLRDLLADEYSEREDDGSPSFTLERAALQAAIDALAQQPAAVDGAMVERALSARAGSWSVRQLFADEDEAPDIMRIALTAALAAQQGGSDNDR